MANPLDDLFAEEAKPAAQSANPLDDILPPTTPQGAAPAAPPAPVPQTMTQGRTENIVDEETGNFISVPVSDQYEAPAPAQEAFPQAENVADLPDPTNVMTGLDFESQKKIYSAYAKHPKSQQTENGLVYDGKRVEPPQQTNMETFNEVASESLGNAGGIAKGVANAGSNVIELGLAGADKLNELEGRGQSTLAKDFRKAVPELKGDNPIQEGMMTIGEIGTGALGGIGIAGKANQVLKLGKVGRAVTTFLGGNAGPGVTSDADSPLLLTGDDSLAGKHLNLAIPALGTDEDGTYSENLLRKRFDLVNDSLATGAVGGAVAYPAGKLFKFVTGATWDKIKNFASLEERQKNMTLDFLDTLAGIDPTQQLTAAEKKTIRDKFLNTLDEETRFQYESGNIDLGSMSGNRRTIHAADRAGISPEALTQAQDFEGGVRKKSLGPIDKADAEVGNVLHEGTERFLAKEGGKVVEGVPENITGATKTIQREAREESAPFHKTADDTEQMLEGTERSIEEDLRTNRVIGERVSGLEDATPEALQKEFATRDTNLEKIDTELKAKGETVEKRLKEASDNIPEGLGMSNPEEILKKAQQLADEKIISPQLLTKIQNASAKGPAGLTSIDYKKLIDGIKQLKREKNMAFGPNAVDMAKQEGIRELDELIKKSTPNDESIAKWNNVYENEYAPVQRTDVTGDLKNISKKNQLNPAIEKAERKATISKAIESSDLTKQMSDVLANPKTGSGRSQHLLDQTLVDDVMDEVVTHVTAGGKLSEISADNMTAGLKKRMAQISKTNPEMGKELATLFKRIKDGQIDVENLKVASKTARDAQEVADREIFGTKYKEFFTDGGVGKPYKDNEDALKAFDNLLDQGQSSELKNVVEAVSKSKNAAAKRGLRAAYIQKLRDRVFDKSAARVKGAKNTLTGKSSDRPGIRDTEAATFGEGDPLYQAGLEIFKDEPDALKFVADLLQEHTSGARLATNSGVEQAGKNTASKEGATMGAGRLITWTLGVLNPTATRVKTISSSALDALNPEDKLAKFAEYLLTDGTNFVKEAQKYMKKESRTLSPEMEAYIAKTLRKAGVREALPEDEKYKKVQKKNLMTKEK